MWCVKLGILVGKLNYIYFVNKLEMISVFNDGHEKRKLVVVCSLWMLQNDFHYLASHANHVY